MLDVLQRLFWMSWAAVPRLSHPRMRARLAAESILRSCNCLHASVVQAMHQAAACTSALPSCSPVSPGNVCGPGTTSCVAVACVAPHALSWRLSCLRGSKALTWRPVSQVQYPERQPRAYALRHPHRARTQSRLRSWRTDTETLTEALRSRYNILSGNRLRIRYARTRAEAAAELALLCLLASACMALAMLGALRLIWLSFAAGPRLALRFLSRPLAVVHEACDTVHLGYLYYRLASGYVRAHLTSRENLRPCVIEFSCNALQRCMQLSSLRTI